MQNPYIPDRDLDLSAWAKNFAGRIASDPARYGLSPGDAAAIQGAADAYDRALAIAINPPTRTAPAVAAKDAARAALEHVCRPYAMIIKLNLGVGNADKLALGLNLINNSGAPIPQPSSNPLLAVIAATQGEHTLRFSDANTPDRQAKPFGAVALQLFVEVGDAPATNPAAAVFHASVTRQPFAAQFTSAANGKTATYFGRWITRKGEVGPWSPPVSFGIVA